MKRERSITVIIPVYNCKKYLRQAIYSITAQPYQNIKILIVDDGSTDGSSLLCDELAYHNKRIMVIHQKNGGISAARNSGLEYIFSAAACETEYVTFLDADDEWAANWLDDRIIKLLEQDYDLIGFQSCFCNNLLTRRSNTIPMKDGEYTGGIHSIWIHEENAMGAMLYRISLIKRYGLRFQNIKASEDKVFSMQCLYLANKIYLINRIMYLYRQNATSATHMRMMGISYFVPIIDAYIRLDDEMKKWENNIRGSFSEGRVLAKIYIMDMIEEELAKHSGAKTLKELFANRVDYLNILDELTGNSVVDNRWGELQKHKYATIMRNRMRGSILKLIRKMYYIGWIKNYIDRKRYPIEIR